jgi:hypothetical protein
VISRKFSTGPGAESATARMVLGEDIIGLPSSPGTESIGDGQHLAAAAPFPPAAPGASPSPDGLLERTHLPRTARDA